MPWIQVPCERCEGRGQITCPRCDGYRGRWVTIGEEQKWEACLECYGRGSVRCPDPNDNGDGRKSVWQD